MKKAIAGIVLFLILAMAVGAFAEPMDFASMKDEELKALIEAATEELNSRKTSDDSEEVYHFPCVVLDTGEYKLEITDYRIMEYEGSLCIFFDVIAENNSDYNIEIDMGFDSIDNWDVRNLSSTASMLISAGKKAKGEMSFVVFQFSDTEVENFEFGVTVWDKDRSIYNLYDSGTLKGTFN